MLTLRRQPLGFLTLLFLLVAGLVPLAQSAPIHSETVAMEPSPSADGSLNPASYRLAGSHAVSPAGLDRTQSTHTVCLDGPPDCDFATIQAGLDVAAPGDTVLVSPGGYAGPLILPGQVTLESTIGPTFTVITATQGPILQAAGVYSVTVRGFTISGSETLTEPVGLAVTGGQMVLEECLVTDFAGSLGDESQPDGGHATAISLTAAVDFRLQDCRLQHIHGGDGPGRGGAAIALRIEGPGQVDVHDTTVSDITGGNTLADYNDCGYGLEGPGGGDARAIVSTGSAQLTVANTQIDSLTGGSACPASPGFCDENAGSAGAIWAAGGTLVVRESQITNVTAWPAAREPLYGIFASEATAVTVEGNLIRDLHYAFECGFPRRPESPYCPDVPLSVKGIIAVGVGNRGRPGQPAAGLPRPRERGGRRD